MRRPTASASRAEVIRRTLDGRLKVSPDGTFRSSDRYLLVGRAQAARPDPVQAAWLYAQMVRWGQVLMSARITCRSAKRHSGPISTIAFSGQTRRCRAGEPTDGVGAFTGPAFDPDDIDAHLDGWKIRRR